MKPPRIDGHKVTDLMWQRHLTASELARRAGTSRAHLARIRLQGFNPSPELQQRLAEALGVAVEDIQEPPGNPRQ